MSIIIILCVVVLSLLAGAAAWIVMNDRIEESTPIKVGLTIFFLGSFGLVANLLNMDPELGSFQYVGGTLWSLLFCLLGMLIALASIIMRLRKNPGIVHAVKALSGWGDLPTSPFAPAPPED